eukprot:m.305102 g.305102  ORF g.305102 m.305102 type:complete len:256 (+) comp16340_c0_seq5:3613-4380(+)
MYEADVPIAVEWNQTLKWRSGSYCSATDFCGRAGPMASRAMLQMAAKRRGLLIVLEGCDRCGKSTQCKRLVDRLCGMERKAELWRFPERNTDIGQIINSYLTKKTELSDQAIHLLYSANRWERVDLLNKTLADGVTVVLDRYAYSGVAFSSAKDGMDLEWCMQPDAGLPAPDLLVHLELGAKEAETREGFGDERYEVSEFQAKVKTQFSALYTRLENVKPTVLDVSGMSIEAVGDKIEALVLGAIDSPPEPSTLW